MRQSYESILQIVTDCGNELGLSLKQQDVITSSDRDTRQIAHFVIATIEDLITRFPWRFTIGTNPMVVTVADEYTYRPASDDDIILIDSRTVKAGTRWRYLHAKGLTYDEDFRTYEKRINDYAFDYNNGTDIDEYA